MHRHKMWHEKGMRDVKLRRTESEGDAMHVYAGKESSQNGNVPFIVQVNRNARQETRVALQRAANYTVHLSCRIA